MQLFYSEASPYARKVHMLLHLNGLIHDTELVVTTFNSELLREKNPLGKIPALIDGQRSLFESTLICEYLNDKSIKNGGIDLYQRNNADYLDRQIIHATANGILDAAVATIMETRRDTEHSSYWLERWQKAFQGAIELLDCHFLGSPHDNHLHIGSIAMVAALGYMDFRLPQQPWRQWNSELGVWYEQIQTLAWVQATSPQ